MPGVLTHFSVAFLGGLLVYLLFRKSEHKKAYGLSFIVGQLIPDTIKFGIPGLMFETANFYEILSKPIYWTLNTYTHTIYTWLALCLIVFLLAFILYKYDKISKDRFKKWIIVDGIFLLSIIIHLILDVLIEEKSYWI